MWAVIWQRLESGTRLALPLLTAVVFLLLGVVTWPLPYFGQVAPPLALVAVYYWAIHRPDLFGPGMAFAIGLLNDILNFPSKDIGISALLFVGAHQLVLSQRRFFVGHSFFVMWWGFALIALLVMLAQWVLLCVVNWQAIPFLPALLQTAIAIVLFPLPCWLLIRLQRGVLTGS